MTVKSHEENAYHFRFDESFVPARDSQLQIIAAFEAFSANLRDAGLTHFVYKAVNIDETGADKSLLDLMYAAPDWIEQYYENDWENLVNAVCHSKPPYTVQFFTQAKNLVGPRDAEFVRQGLIHGMFYDFITHYRDNPMSGGGLSGGRYNEKLDRKTLNLVFGLGVQFHFNVRTILGEAAEANLRLTETELKYLQLMFYGLSVKAISEACNVSRNWVAKACMSARRKLSADTNEAAIAKALALKILR